MKPKPNEVKTGRTASPGFMLYSADTGKRMLKDGAMNLVHLCSTKCKFRFGLLSEKPCKRCGRTFKNLVILETTKAPKKPSQRQCK